MAENDNRQSVENKYGINRERLKKAKGWGRKSGQSGPAEKRKFKLDKICWGVIIALAVDVLLYVILAALQSSGYRLYNYGHIVIEHALFYGIILLLILLVARIISMLPRRESSRRIVVISMVVFCVVATWQIFNIGKSAVALDFTRCATLVSEDGKNEIVVLRADIAPGKDNPDASHYTMYQAYPKLNYFFCDAKTTTGIILVTDGKDKELKAEWTEDALRLYVEGTVEDGVDGEILVPLK
jgi:hypothetical protein